MKLTAHPRLFVSGEHYARLRKPAGHPVPRKALRNVRKLARHFVADPTVAVDESGHNYHLIRARRVQRRVVTLLAEYKRSGDAIFRRAIMADIERIAGWEYWSWITWRRQDSRPEAIFDLSYGENSATLALAFDGLHSELSRQEQALFCETAQQRSFRPFLHVTGGDEIPEFFGHPHSNWNTVCNGGIGMLALALGDVCPEAAMVLERVEESVAPFFKALNGDGGWPEGIGYWNYGMRYGFHYLLSYERATGRTHPLLKLKGTAATLKFPLLFSPKGVACSFGDVNRFSVLPFHYAAAERLGLDEVTSELDRRMMQPSREGMSETWPDDAELALFHPGETRKAGRRAWANIRLMRGLEWGYLADRMPDPNLYVSVRGGTTDAPHVHRDLMSFFCVVGNEKLIENVPVDVYLDTTFSARRYELYETAAASKNTIFINGVSIGDPAAVKTQQIAGRGFEGFRIDATEAMGAMRDGPGEAFCGRAILMVKKKGVLVIDRIAVRHPALVESRLHTFCDLSFRKREVLVRGKKQRGQISWASSEPVRLKEGMGIPVEPTRDPNRMIRLMSETMPMTITIAYFLMPNGRASLRLKERGARATVRIDGDVSARIGFKTTTLEF